MAEKGEASNFSDEYSSQEEVQSFNWDTTSLLPIGRQSMPGKSDLTSLIESLRRLAKDMESRPVFDSEKYHQQRQPLRKLSKSIAKQTDFSSSLASHVISTTEEAKNTNFVFSPMSMHVVLCMVAAGSSGPTRDQFLDFLNSESVEDLDSLSSQVVALLLADGGPLGGPRLSFPNGVWVDQSLTLKPDFQEIVENDYKAAANLVDFMNKGEEARKEVNGWAEKETNGLIQDLLPSEAIIPNTRLVLANALYFKGLWSKEFKFDESLTKDDDFYLLDGTTRVRAPFMTSRKRRQHLCVFDGFKVLSLPYAYGDDSREFWMTIYLPDAIDGLPSLVEKLGSVPGFIQRNLPREERRVGEFRVPKFKINFGFEAKNVLKGHGLVLPFSPGGLTELVNGSLMISSFYHKCCIEMDERGTEAVAASACVGVVVAGAGVRVEEEEEVDFVADHPFLFVVREDASGGVLFVGQLVNPIAA